MPRLAVLGRMSAFQIVHLEVVAHAGQNEAQMAKIGSNYFQADGYRMQAGVVGLFCY